MDAGASPRFPVSLWLWLWLLPWAPASVSAQSHAYRLFHDLFQNYSHVVRPVMDVKTVTQVSVGLDVTYIRDLNERQQQLAASYWIVVRWGDEFLAWEPSLYGGLDTITLPPSLLWRPDLTITNAVESTGFQPRDDYPLTLSSNGEVTWYLEERCVTSCAIDVTKFPFDTQTCPLEIWQWSTLKSQINVTARTQRFSTDMRKVNGEFVLSSLTAETIDFEDQTKLVFRMTLERLRAYFVVSAIVPLLVLSLINLFVFLLPEGSGERLGVCVSLLVSYSVYASALQGSLPETSSSLCVFSLYVTAMFGLKAFPSSLALASLRQLQTSSEAAMEVRIMLRRFPTLVIDEVLIEIGSLVISSAMTTVACILLAHERNRKDVHALTEFKGENSHSGDRTPPANEAEMNEMEFKKTASEKHKDKMAYVCRKEKHAYQDRVLFLIFLGLFLIINIAAFTFIAT